MESPRTLGLLLTDDFSLMSYASVIEPYRAANMLAGRTLYRWRHVSPDGGPARASNGASIVADGAVGDPLDCNTLFVFAAGQPESYDDAATFAWLRRIARTGAAIAGISGGPYLLARAGLLDDHRATIHWEHRAAFAEAFPRIAVDPGLYVIDRKRVTCAGGTGGLDLAIELIEREQGHALASLVSDWFIRTEARNADRPQRASLRERYGVFSDPLLKALAQMEANIEEPLAPAALASAAGVSTRQLERLFRAHLASSIGETYRGIRLAQALQLVRGTSMDVTAIAVACGFVSPSHFARAFRAQHGVAPSRLRKA